MKIFLTIASFIICTLSVPVSSEAGSKNIQYPSIDFSKYPTMQCQVIFSYGSFFGYQPPQRDDFLFLNLSQLSHLKKLEFNSEKGNYIPLFDPLQIEKSTSISETEVINLRLASQHGKSHRIFLDIARYNTSKPVKSRVWIIEEDQIVRSVALMECKFKLKTN